jgi:hypothetical protein
MCDEAQILLKDAKAKIVYIRLEIKRLENKTVPDKSINSSEQTIQELEHHLSIETTVKKGAENAVQILKQTAAKKELLAEAYQNLFQSKQTIALLEEALRRKYQGKDFIQTNNLNQTSLKATPVSGILQVRLDDLLTLSFIFFINIKDFLVVKDYWKMLFFHRLINMIVLVQVLNRYIELYVEKLIYQVRITIKNTSLFIIY